MDVINFFVRLLRDPRTAIAGWITTLGLGPTYAIIFLIIFIETGVVFMPFLPGDSLLFAAGYFAADPKYPITLPVLLPILLAAPILGDQCNYFIGHFFGRRIVESGKVKSLTPERIQNRGDDKQVGSACGIPRALLPLYPYFYAVLRRHYGHEMAPVRAVQRTWGAGLGLAVHSARILFRRHPRSAETF